MESKEVQRFREPENLEKCELIYDSGRRDENASEETAQISRGRRSVVSTQVGPKGQAFA